MFLILFNEAIVTQQAHGTSTCDLGSLSPEILPTWLGLGKLILMLSMLRGSNSSGISGAFVNEKNTVVACIKDEL